MTIRHRSALLDSSIEETSKSTQSNSSAMNMGTNDVQGGKNPEVDSVTLDKV